MKHKILSLAALLCAILFASCSDLIEELTVRETTPPAAYFGTKAPTETKEVGDIVFNDGSATPYTAELKLTNAQKNAAIAIIFYKDTELNSGDDTTTSRTLGVGLKHNRSGLAWCTSSANAYNTNIETIQCPASGTAGDYTFTGDKNGSDNLDQIADFDGVGDTGTEANYPAFYFANKYSETATNLGTSYADNWYLPSIAELFQIWKNQAIVDAASELCGGDKFGSNYYWSSSQYTPSNNYALNLTFGTGLLEYVYKNEDSGSVCAVREFETGANGTEPNNPTTYTISIADGITNGTVTASPTTAIAGTQITLTAEAASGYSFISYNVTDANGNAIIVTDNKFTMPESNVTVSATFIENTLPAITLSCNTPTVDWGTEIVGTVEFSNFDVAPETVDIYVEGQEDAVLSDVSVADGTFTVDTKLLSGGTYNVYVKSGSAESNHISITINKLSGSISYATTTVEKTTADGAFTNTLTITGNGKVTYYSSNTDVATVDKDGEVTIVGAGTATIDAIVKDSNNYTYATKTASYTLTVSAATPALVFRASIDDVIAGDIAVSTDGGTTLKYVPAENWDSSLYSGYTPVGVCVNKEYMINLENEKMTWYEAMDKYPTGGWRMPEMAELLLLSYVYDTLNTSLSKISAEPIIDDSDDYWSTGTDFENINYAYSADIPDSNFDTWFQRSTHKDFSIHVRVVRNLIPPTLEDTFISGNFTTIKFNDKWGEAHSLTFRNDNGIFTITKGGPWTETIDEIEHEGLKTVTQDGDSLIIKYGYGDDDDFDATFIFNKEDNSYSITDSHFGISDITAFEVNGIDIKSTLTLTTPAVTYFGTKAPGEEKAVGDIVFNDGSAIPYTAELSLNADEKDAAIAVIFYVGNELNSGSDSSSRTLGVGLKHGSWLEWCTTGANAYYYDITTIRCPAEGDVGAYTFTGDKNGRDNLEQIATFLEDFDDTTGDGADTKYPAFYFAKNYANQEGSRVSGTSYADNWYLPSIAELDQIYKNYETLEAASVLCGGDEFDGPSYWSSSQYADGSNEGYLVNWSNGNCFNNDKSAYDYSVCAVREF